ncbi:hypothetical protein CCZ37_07445 [Vibrio qinghaiensis]|uniref:Uncharacterized protein n=1 Tax=Vibrio qinghaiensis TaxID=2025808 RepID=A0A223MY39_9VIBR|nr:hypothetical protein [Vibrio qinghaiensis]ASU22434.1 hypothetical protein CCZ37_07445 [Vibrio qinghaiensis]
MISRTLDPYYHRHSLENELINVTREDERSEVNNLFIQIKKIRTGQAQKDLPPLSRIINPDSPFSFKKLLLGGLFIQSSLPTTLSYKASDGSSDIDNNQYRVHNSEVNHRFPRHAILTSRTTAQPMAKDDVKMVKLFDFSCLNNGEDLNFSKIIRQIGRTLQQPITTMTIESQNIISWNKGFGCPQQQKIQEITRITEEIDSIISQVLTLLPGSNALAIAQYIVGPLLIHAANDLEGKPTSSAEEVNLIEQIIQQAKVSISSISHIEQQHLQTSPLDESRPVSVALPKFKINNGSNHIQIKINGKYSLAQIKVNNGKLLAVFPKVEDGINDHREVYYNYLDQEWEISGNGKLNRFSKQEQRLAHELSIHSTQYHRKINEEWHVYAVKNPFSTKPLYLNAIELYGRLVPYRREFTTGQEVIYDFMDPTSVHEVEYRSGEWHLKSKHTLNVSSALKSSINHYEIEPLIINSDELSSPNHIGIQFSRSGKSVIKIDENYYLVTQQGKQLQLGHRKNLPIYLRTMNNHEVNIGLSEITPPDKKAFNLADVPLINGPWKTRIAKQLINKSLPIAKTKIKNTLEIMDNPQFKEHVRLAQAAYFGRGFSENSQSLTKLHHTLFKMDYDLGRISKKNFNFMHHTGGHTTVAELSKEQYRLLDKKPGSKIINVGRDGFYTYYQRMGKSKSAVADLLIHELSHGAPNTLDFVYIGTKRQVKAGDVDVFELINLGNNNLYRNQRGHMPQSVYAGADLRSIDNINVSGSKGLTNADSIAQYISFLSKAKDNPESFNKDYQSLLSAAKVSNNFLKRIEESVLVSRSRRAIKPLSTTLTSVILMVERKSGRYHIYRPI